MADGFRLLPNRLAELDRTTGASSPFLERIAGFQKPLEPGESIGFQFEIFRSTDMLKQVMDTRILASELAKNFISRNDEVLHGNPVIKGTRIPVYQILDCLADGMLPEAIVREFPSIESAEAVTAAIEYASSLCRLNDD